MTCHPDAPGLLSVDRQFFENEHGTIGFASSIDVGVEQARANARRIVACWNALDGVPTEAIEALKNDALEAARESFLRHRRPTGEPS